MSPSSQLTRHASTRLRDKRALPSVQPFCYFTSHSFLTVYFIKSNQALHPQTLVKMLLLQLGETIHSSSMLQNALAFCANAPRDPLALPAALPSHPQPFSTWIQNSDQPSNFVLAIASAVPLLLSCFLPTKKRSLFSAQKTKPCSATSVSSHWHFVPSKKHRVEQGPGGRGMTMTCTCASLNIINVSDALQPGLEAESVIYWDF